MGMSTNLKCCAALSVLGIGLFFAPSVHAQHNYPWKPIQLVVTTAAGGAPDLVAHTGDPGVSASLGEPLVLGNQPPGNGRAAARRIAKAVPNRHPLMIGLDLTAS